MKNRRRCTVIDFHKQSLPNRSTLSTLARWHAALLPLLCPSSSYKHTLKSTCPLLSNQTPVCLALPKKSRTTICVVVLFSESQVLFRFFAKAHQGKTAANPNCCPGKLGVVLGIGHCLSSGCEREGWKRLCSNCCQGTRERISH